MILWIARRGRNVGKEFWGCSTYLMCNDVVNIENDSEIGGIIDSLVKDNLAVKGRVLPSLNLWKRLIRSSYISEFCIIGSKFDAVKTQRVFINI